MVVMLGHGVMMRMAALGKCFFELSFDYVAVKGKTKREEEGPLLLYRVPCYYLHILSFWLRWDVLLVAAAKK